MPFRQPMAASLDGCKLVAYIVTCDQNLQKQGPVGALEQRQEFKDRCQGAQAYFARLHRLEVAVQAEEMNVPGFDFHSLQGFNPKRYSVHVNGPWCITFELGDGEACRVDFEQYH